MRPLMTSAEILMSSGEVAELPPVLLLPTMFPLVTTLYLCDTLLLVTFPSFFIDVIEATLTHLPGHEGCSWRAHQLQ